LEKLDDGGGDQMNSGEDHSLTGEFCVICNKQKEKGIHLYTSFICTECEQEMIHTNTNEPKYQYYIKKLRRVKKTQIYS
jgi:hypothetical protein